MQPGLYSNFDSVLNRWKEHKDEISKRNLVAELINLMTKLRDSLQSVKPIRVALNHTALYDGTYDLLTRLFPQVFNKNRVSLGIMFDLGLYGKAPFNYSGLIAVLKSAGLELLLDDEVISHPFWIWTTFLWSFPVKNPSAYILIKPR